MTGLSLETFLHLLRADLGAWASLGVVVLVLALMAWTSWGSRRALRKCLVLSVVVHLGVLLYGSTLPGFLRAGVRGPEAEAASDGIRQIRVAPWVEGPEAVGSASAEGRTRRPAVWDRPGDPPALAEATVRPDRPEPPRADPARSRSAEAPPPLADEPAAPEVNPPEPPGPEARPEAVADDDPSPLPPPVAPGDLSEIAKVAAAGPSDPGAEVSPAVPADRRLRPGPVGAAAAREGLRRDRPDPVALPDAPALEAPTSPAPTASAEPDPDSIGAARPGPEAETPSGLALAVPDDSAPRSRPRRPDPGAGMPAPGPAPEAVPSDRPRDASTPLGDGQDPGPGGPGTTASAGSSGSASEPIVPEADLRARSRASRPPAGRPTRESPRRLADELGPIALTRVTPIGPTGTPGPIGGRPLAEIPKEYRSRLDPNRSTLAQRAGASAASEQAVERALDWLARHQDADGRWNGGSSRTSVAGLEEEGKASFTAHCPPGETCHGECGYAEADTALTGLALLAYLGAGYTHADGKYAETVRKGLGHLLKIQRADGDLRGPSRSVGMYCHAMAALALCEAYALTGDDRLRRPVERAVEFLVKAQAADGLAWRYAPRDPVGDTSILGWVVLVLRSAKLVGIPVAPKAQAGALGWLGKVSAGQAGGLARYQPSRPVTPTMTAEAWVCRQLLGIGGPGPASTEAAESLLLHGPDKGPYNLYYWYYGTLAMYQHGGTPWTRWNGQVRDQLVRRQRLGGHSAGSWDPDDDDQYGARGGRLYSTALATLTLEVYYRYLRFYDEPGTAPVPDRPDDPTLRRAGVTPARGPR